MGCGVLGVCLDHGPLEGGGGEGRFGRAGGGGGTRYSRCARVRHGVEQGSQGDVPPHIARLRHLRDQVREALPPRVRLQALQEHYVGLGGFRRAPVVELDLGPIQHAFTVVADMNVGPVLREIQETFRVDRGEFGGL